VRAHLHGGVPVREIDALQGYLDNYPDVRELLFQPRGTSTPSQEEDRGGGCYLDFSTALASKDRIKPLIRIRGRCEGQARRARASV